MSLAAVIGVAVTICVVPVVWLLGRRADKSRQARFAERAEMPLIEVWGAFSREAGINMGVVTDALRRVEEATGVAKGRLRPSDRFAVELAPAAGWEFDDGLAELDWGLQRHPGRIETVGDFVRAVSEGRALALP